MNCGVCVLSVVPLRAEASERAEMVSQLLFGDTYFVLETTDNWLKVKTSDCGYEGWLNLKNHHLLSDTQCEEINSAEKLIVRDFIILLRDVLKNQLFPVFIGTSFPKPTSDNVFALGDLRFELPPAHIAAEQALSTEDRRTQMLRFATSFLRAPYLWGGRTPAGIDCSGFTQLIYKSIGVQIPRDASQQVDLGETVDFVAEAAAGDLAFFQNAEGRIIHVGMICANHQIIHASGQVRIDKLDETGIFNADTKQYSHSLRVIKKLL